MAKEEAKTPMMRQYWEIKDQYPDCLLFYRLGDFYEMFDEDARIGARELDIVLTNRTKGYGEKMDMCGVPFHAAENYIARLIAKGYKVAICEQVEDPKLAKGLVKREVIRLITPGTLVESSMLEETSHNYLMAVYSDRKREIYGLAYTDISTGEFHATELKGEDIYESLAAEICRVHPAECILPEDLYQEEFFNLRLLGQGIDHLSLAYDMPYVVKNADTLLQVQFRVASVESLGLQDFPYAKMACAMLLQFVHATQKRALDYLDQVHLYNPAAFMVLDANTRRNLEISATMRNNQKKGSLLWVLDATKTAMGARLLRDWLEEPLLSAVAINRRLDGVEELWQDPLLLNDFREALDQMHDLQRLTSRISYGSASPRDLLALKRSLYLLPDIFRLLAHCKSEIYRIFFDRFDGLEDIAQRIAETLADEVPLTPKEGKMIRKGFHAQVDELNDLAAGGKSWLAQLEAKERERTGIRSLKISYNKVFGYYIEISNANAYLVPETYIRKQTLVNAERYITEELKEWETKILSASERLYALEYSLFCELREWVAENANRIRNMAELIANLDCLQSLAHCAAQNGYCRPQVDDSDAIDIRAGRHPVVEKIIGRENYVPNDCYLDNQKQQLIILTGPNMAGKSTYMRQVALIALLARAGSFVPAESARVGKIDRIFTRVGASDDLAGGQSTFMVEMNETSNILRHAGRDSLVILDEIGRGTSTFDGLSIAWAVAEYLMRNGEGVKTLFATHYHELTVLADEYEKIENFSVAVREKSGDIIFLRKIVKGGSDRSYGIQVASLAGLPRAVIQRAKHVLESLEEENRHLRPALSPDSYAMETAEPEAHPLLTEIRELDLNQLTPLAALLKIEDWKKQLQEEEDSE